MTRTLTLCDLRKRSFTLRSYTWDEQQNLIAVLPRHLAEMALFTVNTGCCDQEVCRLRWDWEQAIPELETSVFLILGAFGKTASWY